MKAYNKTNFWGDNMANYVLGLDIGIGSVGVGLIEKETGEIIHKSVNIFPSGDAASNVERRGFRGAKRIKRRKTHRIKRTEDLFDKYDIDVALHSVPINLNPYEIRVRGLNEKLSLTELFVALKNMVKHRGISYLDDAIDEDNVATSGSDYKKAIEINARELKNKTPGEIQLERLEKYGQVRGDFSVKLEDGTERRLINVFSTSEYRKEAERILKTQQQFYPELTDEFIADYLEILTKKRKYYHGPGNEKSRTDYGRYRTNGETLDNIFSILIGKCTYYPDEFRAAKASYSAQEFNLLNDLNNLTVPTETKKLSLEQKEAIIQFVKDAKTCGAKNILSKIAKMIGCKADDITGVREDKDHKAEMHSFEAYRKMKQLETIDVTALTREQLDQLGRILTLNTEREGILESIHEYLPDTFTNEQIDELIQFRKKNTTLLNKGWHSFSLKLLNELIPELYHTSEEQMTILTRLGKQKPKNESAKTKYIDGELITEEIYNPVVAKAVRQTIKIVNTILQEHGEIDTIVVEMARDKNDEDQKKRIQEGQKKNKNEKDAAILAAAMDYSNSKELPSTVFHGHKDLALKIRLWYQQEKRCAYSGREIPIAKLINNQGQYEIDHILPLSLTFDDGLDNKVLVEHIANQEKGQRTPFQAMPLLTNSWSWGEFKHYVINNSRFSKKKREYLLFEEDINKFEVRSKFIARNLVDTRYASRVVLNALQDFFKQRGANTKVAVVRGQFTAQLRRKWGIEKTRDTYHHHAIDALVIAASSQLKLWEKTKNTLIRYSENELLDTETGELISDDQYKEAVFKSPYDNFTKVLKSKELEDSILFAYQQDSKVNRKISDATIYTTRKRGDEEITVAKIKDIYSIEGYDEFLKVYQKDPSKFLMLQHDPITFEKVIKVIVETYPDKEINENGKEVKVSPFKKYYDEHGYVRKYSRKGNGPIIKQLKYLDKAVGKHIDITPKNSSRKVALKSLKPWRADVYFNPETKRYEIMGLKYSDLKFQKGGNYGITKEEYDVIKKIEKISENSVFKFTLYKNNLILVKDTETNEQQIFRFGSRNETNFNYVELKPYDKAKFDSKEKLVKFGTVASSGQFIKSINIDNLSLYKIETNILGKKYIIKNEGEDPQLTFKNF